jgi:hypothetical protein
MPIDLEDLADLLEVVSQCIVVIGFPLALVQYYLATRKEQKDREYGTYNALDDKYIAYQELCLEHPDLDVWDVPDVSPPNSQTPNPQTPKLKQERQLFTILFSIFERAFLMYADMSTEVKKTQWSGWDGYIKSYCKRQNFRDAWKVSGSTFDTKFEKYMNGLIP